MEKGLPCTDSWYISRVSGKSFSKELNNYVLPFAALHHNHLIWRLGLSSLGISDNKTRITEQQISFLAFLPSTFACEVFWSPILNRALIVLDLQFLRWSVLLITAGSSCNLRHFGSFLDTLNVFYVIHSRSVCFLTVFELIKNLDHKSFLFCLIFWFRRQPAFIQNLKVLKFLSESCGGSLVIKLIFRPCAWSWTDNC